MMMKSFYFVIVFNLRKIKLTGYNDFQIVLHCISFSTHWFVLDLPQKLKYSSFSSVTPSLFYKEIRKYVDDFIF